ncbi:MAG: transcriptional regulator [Pseudonocardiales bacterium]|nr:transcriptional regulator [Pseudonocardiales bacterium]
MAKSGPFSAVLDEGARISDPRERERAARDLTAQCTAVRPRLRREAIAELRAHGMTQAEVGRVLGLSPGRISQLEAPRPAVLVERSVPTPPTIRAAPLSFWPRERPRTSGPLEPWHGWIGTTTVDCTEPAEAGHRSSSRPCTSWAT